MLMSRCLVCEPRAGLKRDADGRNREPTRHGALEQAVRGRRRDSELPLPATDVLVSLWLRRPLGEAGTRAVAHALMLARRHAAHPLPCGHRRRRRRRRGPHLGFGAASAVHIISLDLSQTRLSAAVGPALAALLAARGQQLEELRLSHNDLGDAGVSGLANGLVANDSLRRLVLAHVGVGAEGVRGLAGALPPPGLTHLTLQGNERLVGAAAADAVGDLVAASRALERLSLGDAPLGPQLAARLLAGVEAAAARVAAAERQQQEQLMLQRSRRRCRCRCRSRPTSSSPPLPRRRRMTTTTTTTTTERATVALGTSRTRRRVPTAQMGRMRTVAAAAKTTTKRWLGCIERRRRRRRSLATEEERGRW